MPTRVIILTSNHLRHDFFRKALALDDRLEVLYSICEEKAPLPNSGPSPHTTTRLQQHFDQRSRSEDDFFRALIDWAPDKSNPVHVPKNALNDDASLQNSISSDNPDVLICYGTSIIREPLLSTFQGRFLNLHLGLSPYYRGGGTNFWPIVNGEPEFIGVTFMHIDAGVDTGDVVHQLRASIYPEDSPHSIGNRLIRDMVPVTAEVVTQLPHLERKKQSDMNPLGRKERVYRRRDFTEAAVQKAYANVANGLFDDYLQSQRERDTAAPIVSKGLQR